MEHYTEGILFDFNGTLFLDHDINIPLWKEVIRQLYPEGNIDELIHMVYGIKNGLILEKLFKMIGKEITPESIMEWSTKKELMYQQYCIDHHRNQMTKGASELLDYLKENNVPINLCTNSIAINVDFYFKNCGLARWFDRDKVVYDSGDFNNKTEMYTQCAINIGKNIQDCIIIEDSPMSIEEAHLANPKEILALTSQPNKLPDYVKVRFNDFDELDRSLLGLKISHK